MKVEQSKLDATRDMLATVVPEISDAYVRDIGDFAGLPVPSCVYGFAIDSVFEMRPMIERLGDDYRGPAHLVAIDGSSIEQYAAPGQFDRCLAAVLVHEACHVAHSKPPLEIPSTPRIVAMQTAQLERAVREPEPEPFADDAHDWRFVRRCAHATYRCLTTGIDIPWRFVLGHQYPVATLEYYLMTLLGECRDLSTESFAAIEDREPPAAFLEVWREDQQYYLDRQKFWAQSKQQRQSNVASEN